MAITIVRDIDSFRELKNEWNALLEDSGNSTLFLRWEWMFTYYEHRYSDEELFLLLVRNDGGELQGIAPFVLRKERVIAMKTYLEIMGQRHSSYLGIIAQSDSRDEVYREILDYVFKNRSLWDSINLTHLLDENEFKIQLESFASKYGYLYKANIKDACKAIRLTCTFQEYMSGLDKHLAKKMRYYLRSMHRDSIVELSFPKDENTLKDLWRAFVDLHETRVHNKGGKTPLSDESIQKLFYCIAMDAFKEDSLCLAALKLDGQIAAVLFGIIWKSTFYFVNIGYKEHSKYSLGLVLPLLCIEKSIGEGLQWFDLLGGGGDYKERLGGVDRGGGLNIQVMRTLCLYENIVADSAKRIARKLYSLGKLCAS